MLIISDYLSNEQTCMNEWLEPVPRMQNILRNIDHICYYRLLLQTIATT